MKYFSLIMFDGDVSGLYCEDCARSMEHEEMQRIYHPDQGDHCDCCSRSVAELDQRPKYGEAAYSAALILVVLLACLMYWMTMIDAFFGGKL